MSPQEFRMMDDEQDGELRDDPGAAPEGEPTPAETEVAGIILGLMRINVPFTDIGKLLRAGLASGDIAKIAALMLSGIPLTEAYLFWKQPGLCTALLRGIQASHPPGSDPR